MLMTRAKTATGTAAGLTFDKETLGQVVLVFQGGGALGAYQAGVYEAMQEVGLEPDWVVNVIGAVGNYGEDTTIGYFTVRDLFKPEDAPGLPMLKRSNQRLMLYMSSEVVARRSRPVRRSTITSSGLAASNAPWKRANRMA